MSTATTTSQTPCGISLYLRADGSLMVVHGDQAIEIQLTPSQLLQLGADALHLAAVSDPFLLEEVVQVLSSTTFIVPIEDGQHAKH
jgi:hypothetical protein